MVRTDHSGDLDGRIAIVTGANAGIGLATVADLASRGVTVACVVRHSSHTDELAAVAARRAGSVHLVRANLDDVTETANVVPRVAEDLGGVDILVNNAGITDSSAFLDQSIERFEEVIAVDLRAPFVLSQAAARVMIAGRRGGRIVNLSSSVAFRAIRANPAYASAKGGLNALTRSAAGALGEFGITVNAVVPGPTATAMARVHLTDDELEAVVRSGPLQNLLGTVSTPEDVAAVVTFLCTDAARQITGQMIHVSAGAVV